MDDGCFWIPYHDFCVYFCQLFVCLLPRAPLCAHTAYARHGAGPVSLRVLEFEVPPAGDPHVSVQALQTGRRGLPLALHP